MPFTVVCDACGARFALPDDLYERKFKDRLVTVRCKHCGADISVDGVELASGPVHAIPNHHEPLETEEAELDLTPTVPLAGADTVWTVSFSYEDDRELGRDEIARALERGDINAETIVWREGMDDWLPISKIPTLADLLPGEADATGGFLGTGMQLDAEAAKLKKRAPPPHPAKRLSSPPRPAAEDKTTEEQKVEGVKRPPPPRRRADSFHDGAKGPTTGKARALSPGTLFVGDKPAPAGPKLPTAPKAPIPAWKANLPKTGPAADTDPPSSGPPALTDLTTRTKEPAEGKSSPADDDVLAMGGGGVLLAPPAFDANPPSIDIEPIEAAPAPGSLDVELDSGPAPAADVARPTPRADADSRRRAAGLLLIGGAVAFSVWWFGFKRTASTPSPATTTSVSQPAPPAETAETNTATPEPGTTEAEPPSTPSAHATTAEHAPAAPAPANTTHAEVSKHPAADQHAQATTHDKEPAAPTHATSEPTAAPTAEKPAAGPFDQGAAIAALNAAAGAASSCRKEGDPSGTARVVITFAPSGRVTTAQVNGPPFAGTPTGGCIAGRMRGAHVPPFTGGYVTVHKTVVIH